MQTFSKLSVPLHYPLPFFPPLVLHHVHLRSSQTTNHDAYYPGQAESRLVATREPCRVHLSNSYSYFPLGTKAQSEKPRVLRSTISTLNKQNQGRLLFKNHAVYIQATHPSLQERVPSQRNTVSPRTMQQDSRRRQMCWTVLRVRRLSTVAQTVSAAAVPHQAWNRPTDLSTSMNRNQHPVSVQTLRIWTTEPT